LNLPKHISNIFFQRHTSSIKAVLCAIIWICVCPIYTLKAQTDSNTVETDPKYRPSFRPNFRFSDRYGDPFSNRESRSPFNVGRDIFKPKIEIDSESNTYTIEEKIGEIEYRPKTSMSLEEYEQYQENKGEKDYMKSKAEGADGESATSGRALIPKIYLNPVFDRIFGGNYVDIRPNGSIMLDFGGQWQRVQNPALPIRMQRNGNFQFDQQINLNVQGQIGEKMKLNINHDTKANFDFDNQLRLNYGGKDHEIIQRLEAGNVSMPISSSLISGAQNLFGLKTQLQFGRLKVTSVISSQRGRASSMRLEGGVQSKYFNIRADNYEANRHFFLATFFRENYERWLRFLPAITSGLNVTRVEVYVTNRAGATNTNRNVLALLDLGDPVPYRSVWGEQNKFRSPPDNMSNRLYQELLNIDRSGASIYNSDQTVSSIEGYTGFKFEKSTDYEFLRGARKLRENIDFRVSRTLGYISLNTPLRDDEVLGVAFEFIYQGRVYRVGELQDDYGARGQDSVVILKLIRPSVINTRLPTWDLQMKNIYSLENSQISRDKFQLRIIYRDDSSGVDNPSMPVGRNLKDVPLLQVFNLDRLNPVNELQPDGNFDFIDTVTIDALNGRIIFPVLEPFGSNLRAKFELPDEQPLVDKYVFDELYRLTKPDALQAANKAKFFLTGRIQASASNEIQLETFNLAPGSVKVLAGTQLLTEGVHYEIDYQTARLRIKDPGILSSGQALDIQYEKADLVQFVQRSFMGTRFDYTLNKDINFGGTFLYMNERPLIRRVQVGDEPSKNVMLGLDVNYKKESRFLTRMVDAIPLISTKEPSSITVAAEYAHLIPGTSRFVDRTGKGISYIDDFEGIRTPYTLGTPSSIPMWKLATTPVGKEGPGFNINNPLRFNDLRGKLAWYSVDPLFYRTAGGRKPANITQEDVRLDYVRAVGPQEVFPNRDLNAANFNENVFDMIYFPRERGQYNYSTNVDNSGNLLNPERNWGGVMRALSSDNDFDAANIEYIEFWMMDPFIQGPRGAIMGQEYDGGTGRHGQLFFNLGNISEDVLRDTRMSFEQGLATVAQDKLSVTTETPWGRVPRGQIVQQAFDARPETRVFQDVGLDGMNNEDEREKFADFLNDLRQRITDPDAMAAIENDPSSDDFRYYLNPEYDQRDAKVIERYKAFNNYEGNSPISQGNDIAPQFSVMPDQEDINRDFTLNELNAYYSYRIDLNPSAFQVGRNYIIDQIDGKETGTKWYLFRIPIRDQNHPNFAGRVGPINDFKTLRFLRMYLTGFRDPVAVRLVQFQYVGNQWRIYPKKITNDGVFTDDEDNSALVVGTVNIEENGSGGEGKVAYVTPPGALPRDRDVTSGVNRRLNEQSLSLCIDRLPDGEAKAVFKNVRFDFLNYKRLRMFVHAHSFDMGTRDNEMTLFIRLGTDFTENYYEYELPLKLSPLGSIDPAQVWPAENELNVLFSDFTNAKLERNVQRLNFSSPYRKFLGEGKIITVLGNPDLNQVVTIMIGVRNPSAVPGNDGKAKSACVWVNELRVTDFDKNAGWAATASVNMKLADFANVTLSGRHSTPGFGGIEQRISERSRETKSAYNLASNVTLDKFLPKQWGIKIPMYVGYEAERIVPLFDPLNPDVRLADTKRDNLEEYRAKVLDRQQKRSINFTNVQKVKTGQGAKSYPWDVENLNFTYAYSEITRSNVNIESFSSKNYLYSVGYNYNGQGLSIEPFKSTQNKIISSPYMKWFKELNVSLLPTAINVRGDLNRIYTVTQLRSNDIFAPPPRGLRFYEKSFLFNRTYGVRYSPFKSLTLDYSALVNAIIDEPTGPIDDQTFIRPGFTTRDSVRKNLRNLGRMKTFNQNIRAGYRLPLDKFPMTDWISADVAYNAGIMWQAAPLGLEDDSARFLGNNLQNSREQQINGRIDLTKLYNKVKFLNEINNPKPKPKPKPGQTQTPAKGKPDDKAAPKEKPKTKYQIQQEKLKAKQEAKKAKEAEKKAKAEAKKAAAELKRINKERRKAGLPDSIAPGLDTKGKEDKKKDPGADKDKPAKKLHEYELVKGVLRGLMSVRNVNFSYALTEQTVLPGYTQTVDYLGINRFSQAPGWGFILGDQDPNIRFRAAENGWLSISPDQTYPFTQTKSVNMTARTAIEPIKDLRIQVDVRKVESDNYQEIFRTSKDSLLGFLIRDEFGLPIYNSQGSLRSGTYSISYLPIRTAFSSINAALETPEFIQFRENRELVRRRLYDENPAAGVFSPGDSAYKPNSQDVLIPSFISAYTGLDPATAALSAFPRIPLPNWRLDYGGLAKIPALAKKFTSISLTHGYVSNYSVQNFVSSPFYGPEKTQLNRPRDLFADLKNENNALRPVYNIQSIAITERFAPLIGINMRTKSKITLKFDYNWDRNVVLNVNNGSITENRNSDFTFGAGYQKAGVKLPLRYQGRQIVLKNELTVRADISIRDNTVYQRPLGENERTLIVQGVRNLQIRPTANYMVNQRLNLQFYFERTVNSPKTTLSFPTALTRFGIQLRFNLI
jgi:cell surface protein SprA